MNETALTLFIFSTIAATVTQIGYYWRGNQSTGIASCIWTIVAIISAYLLKGGEK